MTTTLTPEGQIATPRELIEQLELAPGQPLEVRTHGDLLVAWKKNKDDSFAKWRGLGALPAGQTTDEYLRLTRDGDRR